MRQFILSTLAATASITLLATASLAHEQAKTHDHSAHGHSHAHPGDNDAKATQQIYKGYFDDAQVALRPLSDWAGNWQSVYPYLQDGTLAPVMAHKAAQGSKSAEDYHAYYETGYKTDAAQVDITADGQFTFHKDNGSHFSGQYESDGFEILTYAKGNRGVRFIFRKVSGDEAAPTFIQFSDHRIAPSVSDHFHLYWGNDRDALLEEVTHWPTYYPAQMSGSDIVTEMMAH